MNDYAQEQVIWTPERAKAALTIERGLIVRDLYKNPDNPDGLECHKGQQILLKNIFVHEKERGLCVNSRNWGKTEMGIHIPARISLTREHVHPDYPKDQPVSSYYVAPTKTLATEIIYSSGRIYKCVPKKYILQIKEHEKTILFTLDGVTCCGILKILGTQDIYGLIGVKHAGPMIIDELAWTKEGWHEAREQDYLAWNPLVLGFTTWPKEAPHFIDKLVEEYKTTPAYFFMQRPQSDNIFLERRDPGYAERQRERYMKRGDETGYRREVLSERVVGGAEFIFPNFRWDTYREAAVLGGMDPDSMEVSRPREFHVKLEEAGAEEHVWPDHIIREYIGNDWDYCTKIIHVDPGHSSVFAISFDMVNPYTKDYYRMRELYLRRIEDLSVRNIMQQVVEVIIDLWGPGPHAIKLGYDEAEKWFASEVAAIGREIWNYSHSWASSDSDFFQKCRQIWEKKWNWAKTSKSKSPEGNRITTIRDLLGFQKARISHLCPFTIKETANLRLKENGDFPDADNHTVDNWRYAMDLIGYTFDPEERPRKVLPRIAEHLKTRQAEKKRARRTDGDDAWGSGESWGSGD